MHVSLVYVVGASGFLGTALVRHLQDQHRVVHPISRNSPLLSDISFRKNSESEGVAVVWLASSVTPASAETDQDSCKSDYSDFESVVEWLSLNSPQTRIVLASSGGAVYGDSDSAFSEESPISRAFAYSRLKLDMEQILVNSNLGHAILRVANAYGPGQRVGKGQGVLAEWLNSIYSKEALKIFGTLDISRDFVHVDDVARAFGMAASNLEAEGLFNIGSGIATKLSECVALLEEITEQNISVNVSGSRNVDRRSVYLDITRAKDIFGWEPMISLKEGLINWWKLINNPSS